MRLLFVFCCKVTIIVLICKGNQGKTWQIALVFPKSIPPWSFDAPFVQSLGVASRVCDMLLVG